MRRPTDLVVDTSSITLNATTTSTPETTPNASSSKLPLSPQSSMHSVNAPSVVLPAPSPPQPSIRLLFSLVPRRDLLLLVLPAVFTSMLAGGVSPFMTLVIGQAFDAYSKFPITPNPPQSAKNQLLHDVGMTAIELVALAVGALLLSSITSSLWIWTGERNLLAIRKQVYAAVTRKDMIWFDTKMGAEDSTQSTDGEGPVGAGGLMAKFARETDDVRMASSLASGMLIQYLTTTITCLILAFTRSWLLTLVILSAVPLNVFIQVLSQAFAGPNLNMERAHTATAATLVDRAIAAIATVKAFNAELHEERTLGDIVDKIQGAANKCITVWGITSSMSQFVAMAMFVQGFWFGSKLVRNGTISVGDVTAVFWACLIASSNLQMCIPQFIVLAKGKFSMAALITLVESQASPPMGRSSSLVHAPLKSSRRTTHLRKIRPHTCAGGIELSNVMFAYPSRPTMPVLRNIDIFLPAKETTFIVGGSGSGKSTVAQLLLRLYDLQDGVIQLDQNDLGYLDEDWTRQHISAVSQTCILFDMTVHDNVAMGLAGLGSWKKPEEVSREEVEAVCRAALMHEFVRDLPDGYDTKLGTSGANLSGGQKQRLAIARALLRNPTVLILDEATSALDATSRLLVFEAIKLWRKDMTTIVITHDLSQITADDFVYVLKSGELAEQGYRVDLEACETSEFLRMARVQGASGGFPEKEEHKPDAIAIDAILERQDAEKEEELEAAGINRNTLKHQSLYRPITISNWMLDVVADLTRPTAAATAPPPYKETYRVSRYVLPEAFAKDLPNLPQSPRRSLHISVPSPVAIAGANRRYSLPFTPTSPTSGYNKSTASFFSATLVGDDNDDVAVLEQSVYRRTTHRRLTDTTDIEMKPKRVRAKWDEASLAALKAVKVDSEPAGDVSPVTPQTSFFQLMRAIYPTIPHKPVLFFGLLICLASGAMTPIFSYLLSRLLYEVSIGAKDVSTINMYGGIVLAVAAADGIFMGLKYAVMEFLAMSWVTKIRKSCIKLVLAQDKKWFDKSENSPVRLMQILIKDGDDARSLIATVFCQLFVVIAMLGIGLIWALVRGWQLTLVGLAIAPVFAVTMAVQTNLVTKCEVRNKRAREDVAKGYYDAITNVRGIRAMGFETAFQEKFDHAVDQALSTGVQGAFVEGSTYGVASALIYLAEALLFYVGAVMIARGTYDYLRMIQVLNLVVFSVSIGSQLMAFTQRIAKSVQATRDFNELLKLSTMTDESRGTLRPQIEGSVAFNNISFSYPERPDVPILKDLSFEISDSECIAIVGASGSGKSTVAALLQRLYEPASGSITIGKSDLRSTDVHHLRDHVAVVSQNPNLFDSTIAENIAYGTKSLSESDIKVAAKAANVHDFIMSLPKGYSTLVGENASLISGGQAQRLQIARALARPSNVLILDECTSALDAENQAVVMETIKQAKVGRTTLMVTHKLPVMRMCDRILVMHDGVVAEQGTYEELMHRRGVFAQLASGGEWMD